MKLRTNGLAITFAACSLVACGDDDGSSPTFEDSGSSATSTDARVTDAGAVVGLDGSIPSPTDSGPASSDGSTDAGRDAAADSATPTVDSGSSNRDSGTRPADSGTSPRDSGTPAVDSGTPVTDSGTAATDSGTTATDSGTAAVDSGTAIADSGMPGADSGTPPGGDLALTASCLSCANANCNPNPFSAQNLVTECKDAICLDIVECAVDTNCAINEASSIDPGSISRCYCGAITPQECADNPDYEPNGACRELFEQGVDTTDKSEVTMRVTQDTYPGADAFLLLQCLSEFCMAECGPELIQ